MLFNCPSCQRIIAAPGTYLTRDCVCSTCGAIYHVTVTETTPPKLTPDELRTRRNQTS